MLLTAEPTLQPPCQANRWGLGIQTQVLILAGQALDRLRQLLSACAQGARSNQPLLQSRLRTSSKASK